MGKSYDDIVDGMVDALVECAIDDPGRFNSWELDFIERMEDIVENWHLTPNQATKVEEIYLERVKAK